MNGDTLLQAILDDPADDLPRLAYADWLEETGGEANTDRVSFIRGQLARQEATEKCHVGELIAVPSSGNLRIAYPAAWQARQEGIFPVGCEVMYQRGFVRWCSMAIAEWLEYGPKIVTRHPIEGVTITDRSPDRNHFNRNSVMAYWFPEHKDFTVCSGDIPEVIYHFLQPRNDWTLFKAYESTEKANNELSSACILWAKHAAKKTRV